MSLIFAVFLANPAPICVLDEVDAPLDDANVERFCDLLDEMRKHDRHALHRHHPQPAHHGAHGSAVRRDHAERGVSQLVSVDLGQAERFSQAS